MTATDSLALGAAHAVPAISTDPHRDAALIAACAAFDALERRANATFIEDERAAHEEAKATMLRNQLREEQESILDRIMSLRATTFAGIRAKVQSLMLENLEILKDGPGDRGDCLITSICEDVLRGIPKPVIAPEPEPVLALIAEANRLRAEVEAFLWDKDSNAEFDELCIHTSAAIHAVAATPTTSGAELRAVAQFLLEEQTSGGGSDGFNHSDAENAALILLKRLAADPVPSNPDAGIIALCDQSEVVQLELHLLHDRMGALTLAEERAFDEERVQPAFDKATDTYDKIVHGPAPQTYEGLRAAARAAILHGSDPRLTGPHKVDTSAVGSELAWKLVGQLAGLEVRPMWDGIG